MSKDNLAAEAHIFCNYLVGNEPSKNTVRLYQAALKNDEALSSFDQKLINLALKRPSLLQALDGGAALIAPNSALRKRIYVMFAIVEASPEYTQQFLPTKRSPFYIANLFFVGVWAVLISVVGVVIIKAQGSR